jgi:hypothetical protein
MTWRDLPRPAPQASTVVRWEAEHPSATNFPPENPFAPGNPTEAAALSAGAWIGAESHGRAFFLEYTVDVPKAASYQLYARKFWKHGPSRFRFDEQGFQSVGGDVALLDEVPLRQFVVANWVDMGRAELTAGRHVLRIELDKTHGASAWDAFVLTDGPFRPHGQLAPGQAQPAAPDGWFTFDPELDTFEASPLDLSRLNAAVPANAEPITARGGQLLRGSSAEPLRIWGVGIHEDSLGLAEPELDYLARSLAKRGVNFLRIHTKIWQSDDFSRVDPKRLDAVQHLVAALAARGIYTSLSIYFPLTGKPRAADGFPGYDGERESFALQYFDDRFAGILRGWWRQILTQESPYARPPLGRDPALALLELVNEDSSLFWTFNPYEMVPAAAMPGFERRFGAWLVTRYGSLQRAFDEWGQPGVRGDDVRAGRAGFVGLWSIAHDKTKRGRDTAEFLTRLMRDFYGASYRYLKDELGFRGVVVCSNWLTADGRVLGPLDKWANTVCDAMDHHGYYGGPHTGGPGATYAVSQGDRYTDASALRFDPTEDGKARQLELPIADATYDGKPSLVSEIGWARPNRFRAEAPFVAAAYGSLQGTAGLVFSTIGSPGFDRLLGKFSVSDPAILGQFPAAALAFRRGYVRTGAPVVTIDANLDRLFALEGWAFGGGASLDALRSRDVPSYGGPSLFDAAAVHPLTYLVGPIALSFGKGSGKSELQDLTRWLDTQAGVVKSVTGELAWSWHDGVATIDAPRVQGATGFLAARERIELTDVRVEAGFEYGTVLVVSLDGAPIASSSELLVQVMTEAENQGFRTSGDKQKTIDSTGGPPVVVKRITGAVSFKRGPTGPRRFVALDPNGRPWREATTATDRLVLLPDALYYVVTRSP